MHKGRNDMSNVVDCKVRSLRGLKRCGRMDMSDMYEEEDLWHILDCVGTKEWREITFKRI